jgi:hypothetical protein
MQFLPEYWLFAYLENSSRFLHLSPDVVLLWREDDSLTDVPVSLQYVVLFNVYGELMFEDVAGHLFFSLATYFHSSCLNPGAD